MIRFGPANSWGHQQSKTATQKGFASCSLNKKIGQEEESVFSGSHSRGANRVGISICLRGPRISALQSIVTYHSLLSLSYRRTTIPSPNFNLHHRSNYRLLTLRVAYHRSHLLWPCGDSIWDSLYLHFSPPGDDDAIDRANPGGGRHVHNRSRSR